MLTTKRFAHLYATPDIAIILGGFTILLSIMISLILVSLKGMTNMNDRMHLVSKTQNIKTQLVYTMRFAARERSLDLFSITVENDWFKRDERIIHFHHMAAVFSQARTQLLAMTLSPNEQSLLDKQSQITRLAVPLQESIIDLVMNDQRDDATALLMEKAIPAQNQVFNQLDQLIATQNASAHAALAQTQLEYLNSSDMMRYLGILAVIVSITISLYVINRIARYTDARKQTLISLNRFASFPEQNPAAVVEIDANQTVSYRNPAAATMFPDLDSVGNRHPLFNDIWPIVSLLDASQQQQSMREHCVNDHCYAQWITTVPDSRIVRVFAFDITERKKVEKELQQHRDNLESLVSARTTELEAANEELKAFSYSVSHDLRAPLRHIDGFSHALLEDYESQLDSTARNYLHRIRQGTQNMSQLIDDMLALSRVSRQELQRNTVDLSTIARNIAKTLQEQAPQRQVKFTIAEQTLVEGDTQLLQIALTNLISNAWKYSSKQKDAHITLGTKLINGVPVYFVRDNGAGFNMKYADKLFVAFQRLHSPDEFKGSGIGLATVNRIIHRHGGRVWAESKVNAGATFYFTLTQQIPNTSKERQSA